MSVVGFSCSPLRFVSTQDKVGYRKRKLEQVCAAVKDKVAIALDLESDLIEKKGDKVHCCQKVKDFNRLMDMVREKVKFSERKDQLKYLTLVPDSWTVKEIEDFFGVGNSIARKSKELKKEKGLVPEIAEKKGKVMATDIAECVAAFYEDDQFSRNCPGKKDFVSERINGEKFHKQKRLLLVNLKKLHQEFKKSCNKDISFSKFGELCPKWYIPVGSASGAHSVCDCQIHQNAKLMANVIHSIKDYKELLGKMVRDTNNRDYMLHSFHQCPRTAALKEKPESIFNEYEKENKIQAMEKG